MYEVLSRFTAASLSWPLPEALSPEKLEKMLFPSRKMRASELIAPDWLYIDTELRRPGVTIFVAVMGSPNYTYVEACLGQDMMSWLNTIPPFTQVKVHRGFHAVETVASGADLLAETVERVSRAVHQQGVNIFIASRQQPSEVVTNGAKLIHPSG